MIPPPTLTITPVDSTALSEKLGRMAEIFYERGAQPTMLQRFVQTEAGQWAGDAADILGPKTESAGMAGVQKEVKEHLSFIPRWENLQGSQRNSSDSNYTWLQAGPNFLLAVRNEDNQLSASPEEALAIYRAGQKGKPRLEAFIQGDRVRGGHQHVVYLNRVRVSQSTFKAVVRLLKGTFGKARASFASTTLALGLTRRFPAFVLRHVESVREEGRAILETGGLENAKNPTIVFGSHAPGVESNPKMVAALQDAAEKRTKIAAAKLRKLVAGAVYNINTGQVYRTSEPTEEEI